MRSLTKLDLFVNADSVRVELKSIKLAAVCAVICTLVACSQSEVKDERTKTSQKTVLAPLDDVSKLDKSVKELKAATTKSDVEIKANTDRVLQQIKTDIIKYGEVPSIS